MVVETDQMLHYSDSKFKTESNDRNRRGKKEKGDEEEFKSPNLRHLQGLHWLHRVGCRHDDPPSLSLGSNRRKKRVR